MFREEEEAKYHPLTRSALWRSLVKTSTSPSSGVGVKASRGCARGAPPADQSNTVQGSVVVPRLRECLGQSQAEVVSKSWNKIHQTRGPPCSRALYIRRGRLPPSVGHFHATLNRGWECIDRRNASGISCWGKASWLNEQRTTPAGPGGLGRNKCRNKGGLRKWRGREEIRGS